MGTGGEDKKERGEERKGGEKSMHLRERAPPLIFWWLNTADNAIVADLCTHVHHHRADERTSPPPLFSRLQFNTQIGSRDNATGPRKQPLSLPFLHTHTHAHTHTERQGTRLAEETEVRPREKYQKGERIRGRGSILFPRSSLWFLFRNPPLSFPFATMRGTIARKSVPSPPSFCSVEKFSSVFFPGGFSKDSSCRSISLGEGKEVVLAKRSQDCMIRGEDTRRQRKVLGKKGRRREGRRWKFRENRTRKFYFTIKFFFDEIPRETWKLDSYSIEWRGEGVYATRHVDQV